MNSLNRTIKPGEHVVVANDNFGEDFPVAYRTFICEAGFGLAPHTSGLKISGRWADGSGEDVIEGTMIDPDETALLKEQN